MPFVALRQSLYQRYWRWISRYLDKRQPAADTVVLTQKLIFILPSRYGCWFMLLTALLYLLGTNYQNNLILLLSYLMLSLFLLCIVLTYQNMSGLTLRCPHAPELFADTPGIAPVQLSSAKNHFMLQLNFIGHNAIALEHRVDSAALTLKPTVRGCYLLPRLKISSDYPFGLWRSWSYIAIQQQYWVYPAPVAGQQQPAADDTTNSAEQDTSVPSGDNLAPYRSGDSLRYLLWKRLARDPYNPVIRQQHHSPEAKPDWVEVPPASGDALERALSIACQQLLALEQSGNRYGLKLRGTVIAQSNGPGHLQRCLQELALC